MFTAICNYITGNNTNEEKINTSNDNGKYIEPFEIDENGNIITKTELLKQFKKAQHMLQVPEKINPDLKLSISPLSDKEKKGITIKKVKEDIEEAKNLDKDVDEISKFINEDIDLQKLYQEMLEKVSRSPDVYNNNLTFTVVPEYVNPVVDFVKGVIVDNDDDVDDVDDDVDNDDDVDDGNDDGDSNDDDDVDNFLIKVVMDRRYKIYSNDDSNSDDDWLDNDSILERINYNKGQAPPCINENQLTTKINNVLEHNLINGNYVDPTTSLNNAGKFDDNAVSLSYWERNYCDFNAKNNC